MTLVIVLLAAAVCAELLLHSFSLFWRARKVFAVLSVILNAFASVAIVLWRCDLWSILLLVLSLYRVLNNLRVLEARMHEYYLQRATRRTTFALIVAQVCLSGLWALWQHAHPALAALWIALAGLQLFVAVITLAGTIRHLRKTAWPTSFKHLSDHELPAISVAIPARNETEDLQACLESIIASDYPKLEILVLDDRSQTRRTPEIIRSFAHDGVRFILGDQPEETWLPKNRAYDRLAHEASGKIVVFCGVDVRFAPDSLRQIVTFMLSRDKKMVSILPERHRTAVARFALIQAMRYWWELAPPRRFLNRPAVLSTCWAIEASALQEAGGFAAVARSIVPEAYFAKRLIKEDQYSFMRAGTTLGLLSAKLAADQRETAVRTRYPQLHRRPENVLIVALAEFAFLVLPFSVAIGGFWISQINTLAQILAAVASICLVVAYEAIAVRTRVNNRFFGLIALPFATLIDLGLLHYSMWRYEFATVQWKGRNVSIPTMHVFPHLPKLPD